MKYGGEKAYSRRRNLTLNEIYAMQSDAVRGDIHLLSYYIKANKERKLMDKDTGNINCGVEELEVQRVWSISYVLDKWHTS